MTMSIDSYYVLNARGCLSMGRAFTYLPLMIDATSAGVAMLLQNI